MKNNDRILFSGLICLIFCLASLSATAQMTPEQMCYKGQEFYEAGNYEEAVKWWQKAVKEKDKETLTHSEVRFTEDGRQEMITYIQTTDRGVGCAQVQLGYCYYYGQGVAQNCIEAAKLWRRAARRGYIFAQYYLGNCYYEGKGVAKDHAQARYWFEKAAEEENEEAIKKLEEMDSIAEKSSPEAMFQLGRVYEVAYNEKKAVEWYHKAAELGHVEAQYNLGRSYLHGWGVEENEVEAIKWLSKAVEQGFAEAQSELGYCYYYGKGVEKDYKQARYWYRKAAQQGDELAKTKLEEMDSKGE